MVAAAMPPDDILRERVYTPGMKRRGVVRVLKQTLKDAERDTGTNRVVGLFGFYITERGEAHLLSAISADELAIVLKALPEALARVTAQMGIHAPGERGN
jgi:hypothetical protein